MINKNDTKKNEEKDTSIFSSFLKKGGVFKGVTITLYMLFFFASERPTLWTTYMTAQFAYYIFHGLWFNVMHYYLEDNLKPVLNTLFTVDTGYIDGHHNHDASAHVAQTSLVKQALTTEMANIFDKRMRNVHIALFNLIIFFVGLVTCRLAVDYYESKLRPLLMADIRSAMFKALKNREFEFFVLNSHAVVMDKFDEIIDRIRGILSFVASTCIQFLTSLLVFTTSMASLGNDTVLRRILSTAYITFLAFLVFALIGYSIITSSFMIELSKISSKDSVNTSLLSSKIWDSTSNIYNVKVNRAEEYEDSYFSKFQNETKTVYAKYLWKLNTFRFLCTLFGYGLQVGIATYAGTLLWVGVSAEINSGQYGKALLRVEGYASFIIKSILLMHHIESLIGAFFEFIEECCFVIEDFERMSECIVFLLKKFNSLSELNAILKFAVSKYPSKCSACLNDDGEKAHGISFNNFSFHYGNNDKSIINNLNLTIQPGEKVGIVGTSGAGKSTLLALAAGLYKQYKGSIIIDGKEMNEINNCCMRRMITIIPQTTTLFNRTVYENIQFGRPEASEQEIYECAKDAYCHDFILSLDGGYDFVVGNAGERLSGGQRQRLMIARAFLKGAGILLVDEATSALDSLTEHYVGLSMKKLFEKKTVLTIAHRVNTLKYMDKIVVIDKGRIVEVGAMKELLEKKEYFYRFWAQMEENEN